jgi:hypothetical protein
MKRSLCQKSFEAQAVSEELGSFVRRPPLYNNRTTFTIQLQHHGTLEAARDKLITLTMPSTYRVRYIIRLYTYRYVRTHTHTHKVYLYYIEIFLRCMIHVYLYIHIESPVHMNCYYALRFCSYISVLRVVGVCLFERVFLRV